jgi:hypothetical protein
MAGRFQEFHQVVPRDRRRHRVGQRMRIDRGVRHQRRVEHHRDPLRGVVDRAERRHRAGRNTERFHHQVRGAEREPAGRAQSPVQRLQLDGGVLQRGDEEQRALLVAEKQVLGVAAGDAAAQAPRLLDREQRRMADRRVRDAEAVEGGEKLVGRGGRGGGQGRGHALLVTFFGRGCKALRLLAIGTALAARAFLAAVPNGCGCSSGVEHDLAKVGVEGSNPFARSSLINGMDSSLRISLGKHTGNSRRHAECGGTRDYCTSLCALVILEVAGAGGIDAVGRLVSCVAG